VVSQTPTVTRACVALDPQFQSLQTQVRAARDIFSDPNVATCPIANVVSAPGAFLQLRKPSNDPAVPGAINYMLWRGDTNQIYVLVRDNSLAQTFRVSAYQDTWKEGDPSIPPCAFQKFWTHP
jgi:hypothetical protein